MTLCGRLKGLWFRRNILLCDFVRWYSRELGPYDVMSEWKINFCTLCLVCSSFKYFLHVHVVIVMAIALVGFYHVVTQPKIVGYGRQMHEIGIWSGPCFNIRLAVLLYDLEVSKPRDWYLQLCDRSEVWCRYACQISKRYEHFKIRSRAFETLRDLTIRRLTWFWNGALAVTIE